MSKLQVHLDIPDYLVTCSRIRGIKPTVLIRRLIDVIARDQLVASVLDDAEEITRRNKSEHRYQGVPPWAR